MVTGDNVQTARAIALECGILTSDEDASEPTLIEGKSFRALTDTERDKISDKISVLFKTTFQFLNLNVLVINLNVLVSFYV